MPIQPEADRLITMHLSQFFHFPNLTDSAQK